MVANGESINMKKESLPTILESRRIDQLYAVGMSDTCGNIMGIVVISILYWPYISAMFILPWACISTASLLLRIYKIQRYHSTPKPTNPDAWRQYYFNNALLNGIAWGLMLIVASFSVPLSLLPYVVMIIAGLTTAPSLNFYNFPNTHSYFAIPAIVPGAIAMIVSGEMALTVLGFLALSWFAITKTNADALSREGEEFASFEVVQIDLERELEELRAVHRGNEKELAAQVEILERLMH